MTNDKLYVEDGDLAAALEYNSVNLPSTIKTIRASIEGANDESDWHWIVELDNGDYAYISGGCDYTGWDCRSHAEAFVEPTLEDAVRQVPEAHIQAIREQLA